MGQKEEIRSKQPTLNSISDIELKQLPSIYPSVQHPAAGSLFVKNASMSFRASVVGFDEAISSEIRNRIKFFTFSVAALIL